MEEGPSNGGMLYHEVQESKLCAVHCVNTVLQGPFFSEFDLAALASDLDKKEHQMMFEGGDNDAVGVAVAGGDFLNFTSEESHNVSMGGDFSIQVLQKALEVWDLQVIPLNSPVAEQAQIDPAHENAFICHLQDHWFSIRKVNGEWYNFDSLYAAPEHLSMFYLSAYLDSLKGSGWSIFIVRGNFPKECPMSSSESSNGYGQWLLPEDALRITKSCNSTTKSSSTSKSSPIPIPNSTNANMNAFGQLPYSPFAVDDDFDDFEDFDDADMKAAIAASLLDSKTQDVSSSAAAPVPAESSISQTPDKKQD